MTRQEWSHRSRLARLMIRRRNWPMSWFTDADRLKDSQQLPVMKLRLSRDMWADRAHFRRLGFPYILACLLARGLEQ